MVPPCYRHRIFSFEVIPSKLNNITSQCVFSNFLSFSFLTFDVAIHLYFNLLLLFMLKLTLVCTSHCLSATSRSSQFFELLLLLCFRTYSHFYLLRRLKCLVKPLMDVAFRMNLNDLKMKSEQQLVFTPVMVGTDSIALNPIIIQGRNQGHSTLGIVHKGNQQHTTETLGKFHTENITFSFANSMYKVSSQ